MPSYRDYLNYDWDDLSRLSTEQMRDALYKLRSAYTRRVKQFNQDGLFSYAQNRFEREFAVGRKRVSSKKLTRAQAYVEVAGLIDFFNAKTSTLEGIRAVNYTQDKRVFGVDESGRPLRRMTNDERKVYWDLYDKYKESDRYKAHFHSYGSDFVQSKLADVMFTGNGSDFGDLTDMLEALDNELERRYTDYQRRRSSRYVYTSGGNNK